MAVVTFQMERGYFGSGLGLSESNGDKSVEERQDAGNWGGSDGWL